MDSGRLFIQGSSRATMSLLVVFALLVGCFASPSDYWALASPSVRTARALLGLGGRVLTAENGTESLAPVWCGQEKYNGAAGKMWYANPFTTACSRASTDLVYVDGNRARVARRGDLIKMHCDNWECPIPPHPLWIATLIAMPAQRMSGAWSQHTRSGVLGPWAEAGTLPTSNCAASPSMRKSRRSHLRAISAT